MATVNVLCPPEPAEPPMAPDPPVDMTTGDAAAPEALDPDGIVPTCIVIVAKVKKYFTISQFKCRLHTSCQRSCYDTIGGVGKK